MHFKGGSTRDPPKIPGFSRTVIVISVMDGPVFNVTCVIYLLVALHPRNRFRCLDVTCSIPHFFLKMSSGLRFLRDPNKGEGLYILKSIS